MYWNPHAAFKTGKLNEEEYRAATKHLAVTLCRGFALLTGLYFMFLSPIGLLSRTTGGGSLLVVWAAIAGIFGGVCCGYLLFLFLYHVLLKHDCERTITEQEILKKELQKEPSE
jgi:hypothetical protein